MLITGGAGFIGANFALRAVAAGNQVTVYDALTYAGNPENLLDLVGREEYAFVHADVLDGKALASAMAGCDVVVHFAAESHVDRSISGPGDFIHTNIVGTFHLLEACRTAWKGSFEGKRFHHVSTDEVYGSLGSTGYFSEETGPRDPDLKENG